MRFFLNKEAQQRQNHVFYRRGSMRLVETDCRHAVLCVITRMRNYKNAEVKFLIKAWDNTNNQSVVTVSFRQVKRYAHRKRNFIPISFVDSYNRVWFSCAFVSNSKINPPMYCFNIHTAMLVLKINPGDKIGITSVSIDKARERNYRILV